MVDCASLAELLSHTITTDPGVTELLGCNSVARVQRTLAGTEAFEDPGSLISISQGPDQVKISIALGVCSRTPTSVTIERVAAQIHALAELHLGTDVPVHVQVHVSNFD